MDSIYLPAVEFSTLILLAQTLIEFLITAFNNTKKAKPKFTLRSLFGYLVITGIVLCIICYFVIFFDFGVRSLILLLQEGGLRKAEAKYLVIVTYYLGFNARKIVSYLRGNKLEKENWFSILFVNTPMATLACILVGFFVMYLKNILHVF